MAKRASRNLAQLRKDNRQSTIPLICTRKGCENEALLIKGPHRERVKICEQHYNEVTLPKRVHLQMSMGLL